MGKIPLAMPWDRSTYRTAKALVPKRAESDGQLSGEESSKEVPDLSAACSLDCGRPDTLKLYLGILLGGCSSFLWFCCFVLGQ